MRVIINSDDLGMNPCVNERILDLMYRRRITSASILANGPAVKDAIRNLPKGTGCSLGVHLNLTEFQPLTPPDGLEPLRACLNEQGAFAGEKTMRMIAITPSLREAMFNELRLQVERLLSLDIQISHFDSHQHIHTIPQMFPVLKRLQQHFGVRKVRTTWNIYSHKCSVPWFLLAKKRIWDFALRNYYQTLSTQGLTTFAVFYTLARRSVLPYDSIELMTHPGHMQYEEETALLYQDWEKEIMFPVQLISYQGL